MQRQLIRRSNIRRSQSSWWWKRREGSEENVMESLFHDNKIVISQKVAYQREILTDSDQTWSVRTPAQVRIFSNLPLWRKEQWVVTPESYCKNS